MTPNAANPSPGLPAVPAKVTRESCVPRQGRALVPDVDEVSWTVVDVVWLTEHPARATEAKMHIVSVPPLLADLVFCIDAQVLITSVTLRLHHVLRSKIE
jgi:hypothetical protein